MSETSSELTLDPVQQLVEAEQIKRLKYRYLRCLDLHEWDELATVFSPDAVASYSGGKYSFEGRDEIMGFLKRSMDKPSFHSSHKCHHPEIDFTSDTTAVATWGLEDVVVETEFDLIIRGAAFYNDEYKKIDGEWKIIHTGYKRVYEEVVPRASIPGISLTASWWTTDGQSSLPAG